MRLGGLAQMPVWRTEDEEYSGQVMRLAGTLCQVSGNAVLSCPASGFDGKEQEPAFLFADLARGLDLKPAAPKGGAFGALPPPGPMPRCGKPVVRPAKGPAGPGTFPG